MSKAQNAASAAKRAALRQYEAVMGYPFPVTLLLNVHDDEGFWALADAAERSLAISIGGGVVLSLDRLWSDALGDQAFVNGISERFVAEKKKQFSTHLAG